MRNILIHDVYYYFSSEVFLYPLKYGVTAAFDMIGENEVAYDHFSVYCREIEVSCDDFHIQ